MAKHKRGLLYPLPVRIWHWVHGIAIVLLVLTGIQLRFPDLMMWSGTFRSAVNIHNIFGFIVVFDYLLWLCFYLVKRELIKQYIPTRDDVVVGIPTQANYYFARTFFGDPPPFEPSPKAKFNALQKATYFGLMFILLPLQIATGVLMWDLERFYPIIKTLGGVRVIDAFHIILAYILASFLVVHFYLATLGHTFFAHFKAMIVGYEEEVGN